MPTTPRFVLIANPGTKRCESFQREVTLYGTTHGITLEVVPWEVLVPRDGDLDDIAAFDRSAIVRIESPGKNDDVTRLLLEAGARDDRSEPSRDWRGLELPKGLLFRPGLWFRGFHRVLRGLRQSFNARPHLLPTACPLAIAEMFDKTATAKRLHRAEIPVPEWLERPSDVFAYLSTDAPDRWPTAYLKLNTGSSAMGMACIHVDRATNRFVGITSVGERNGRYWNTRRLLQVSGSELERVSEFILSEGGFAQRGIAMARIDGLNFDVRVVCIQGRPAATIFRLSPHPMTNLQLGGRRGEYVHCRAAIPSRRWLDALDHCADAAACFDSAISGVDLVFEHGFGQHYILEVNAFGDFFPGWTDGRGRSIHSMEIESAIARFHQSTERW